MRLCSYGCGREAKYHFVGGKWCCSNRAVKCPSFSPPDTLSPINIDGIFKNHCYFCGKEVKGFFNKRRHVQNCYLNPTNLKICPVCDKPIKNYRENTTCSVSCSNTYFRSGKNHNKWKDDVYRSTCFLYHKKKCIICDEENIVAVHHFDKNRNNNAPENLIPMCPTHHQYMHSNFKHLIERKVIFYRKTIMKKFNKNRETKISLY